MRIARFSMGGSAGDPAGDGVAFGVVEGHPDEPGGARVATLAGHPFSDARLTGQRHRLADVRLLPPVLPTKIVAVGENYADRVGGTCGEALAPAVVFLKPSTSVVGSGAAIVYPGPSREVHHQAELAVVVGRLCREVPHGRVPEVIFGYTCANDVTARDLQRVEPQWGRAKGFDTFCPLGPWVETGLDPADVEVACTVNGERRQSGRTKQMVRTVADLIVHISEAMTLIPGDVILTGTPAGDGPLHVGDEVAVSVEGIGTLTNRVVARG
ncbi:MAG: fumarylacetoacetate hydrolase family protein [Carbonactinosporaceae bacterium]